MVRLRVAVALFVAVVAVLTLRAQAQPPSESKDVFEVASIKPHGTFDTRSDLQFTPGGGFRAVNVPLLTILATAYSDSTYGLRPSQIVGGPDWVDDAAYDINAKASDDVEVDDPSYVAVRMRLRALLEDRFTLRTHRERRTAPAYALMRGRADGMLGPGMMRSTIDCESQDPTCTRVVGGPGGRIASDAITPAALTVLLANVTGRTVVDQTGLNGWFRVNLEWSPDQTASDKPSLFTAIQEQLGLKLAATRAPIDVLVIDHVERPTPD